MPFSNPLDNESSHRDAVALVDSKLASLQSLGGSIHTSHGFGTRTDIVVVVVPAGTDVAALFPGLNPIKFQ